jgi:AraC-like DNA-binding protein
MKSLWKTPFANETYTLNTAPYHSATGGIRVQCFCHSFLYPGHRNTNRSYPYILCSLVLSRGTSKSPSSQNHSRNAPGTLLITDLNTPRRSFSFRTETLERYFILFEYNTMFRTLLAQMFNEELPIILSASAPERLRKCFEDVRDALSQSRPDDPLIGGMAFRLLMEAARQMPYPSVPPGLKTAIQYIHAHFCDSKLDRERIASVSGMSVSTLGKLFHSKLKTTVREYIASLRMAKVKRMLSFSDKPVSEVAEQCGFSYSYYLAREFKKRFDITPSEYRKTHHFCADEHL